MAWIENKEILAENINHLLKVKGKTRKEACDELGIHYSTFTEWVNGKKYPRINNVELLANYFGVKKADLIEAHSKNFLTDPIIGQSLKEAREKANLTIAELAEKLDINQKVIKRWEKGDIENLKREVMEKASALLDISPLLLLGLEAGLPENFEKEKRIKHQQERLKECFSNIEFSDEEVEDIIKYIKYIASQKDHN